MGGRSHTLLILAIGLLCQFTFARQVELKFENITDEEGLKGLNVQCFLQDQNGFIWIGTDGGLHRYGGNQFVIFQNDIADSTSVSNNQIQSLVEDANGTLWIGTRGGLNSYNPDTEQFTSYTDVFEDKDILLDKSIRSLFVDDDGVLWVGVSELGLLKFSLSSRSFEKRYEYNPGNNAGILSNHIKQILSIDEENLLIGSDNGISIFNVKKGTFKNYHSLNSTNFPNNLVKALCFDIDSTLWIGTDGGIVLATINDDLKPTFSAFEHEDRLPDPFIKSILSAPGGHMWIATDGGLTIFNKSSSSIKNYKHDSQNDYSLINDHCRILMRDSQGIVWIGTSGGISKYVRARFPFNTIERDNDQRLSNYFVTSVYVDSQGNKWIGTQLGLNKVGAANNLETYFLEPDNPSSISNNYITNMIEDKMGDLWIGTENGMCRYLPRSNSFKRYLSYELNTQTLSHPGVISSFVDINNDLWVGTWNGLNKYEKEIDQFQRVHPKKIQGKVQAVYRDLWGDLWVGKRKGLNRIRLKGGQLIVESFTTQNGLSTNDITAISNGRNGVWIGTNGGGLMYFDRIHENFRVYTKSDGLPSNEIYSLKRDKQGLLWIGTGAGLVRFNDQLNIFTLYDRTDGLPAIFFNHGAVCDDDKGNFYFGTSKGLVSFKPNQMSLDLNKPKIALQSFKLLNQDIRPKQGTILPKSIMNMKRIEFLEEEKAFAFGICVLDHKNPTKIKVSYKLEGYDVHWQETDLQNPEASYQNVPAGDYTLRVRATNSDGIWNDQETNLQIEILPPFYKTWWFIGLISLSFVILVGAIIWVRIKAAKETRRRLTREVRQRTRELEDKNMRLIEANAQISKQNERIVDQSRLIDQESDKLAKAFQDLRTRNQELEDAINQVRSTQNQLIESEKMASIGFLAAGLAHELNNPLNFIGGVIDPVKQDISEIKQILNDEQAKSNEGLFNEINMLLDHIADGSKKATQIIRNLLDLTPTPKNEEKRNAVVDINELLSSCVLLIQKSHADIKFHVDLKNKLLAQGNSVELNQVFINIIKNSIDALEGVKRPEISILGVENGQFIKLLFKDNGGGMDENTLTNIYEPFFTTKGPGKGTGLGMYISRSIIMKHSGEIKVDSRPNHGTEFAISLQKWGNNQKQT